MTNQMNQAQKTFLLRVIAKFQNHPSLSGQDHMSICGTFTEFAEFDNHIENLVTRIDGFDFDHHGMWSVWFDLGQTA